ncbi:MAG: hypothetical protein HXY40_14960 [Chloroflexi bacterium]|nr:hypothetical protein [Chloroflexota bacterium]
MADEAVINYPDLLGYVTGGARCNVSIVQVALALRPRVVKAGRSFEVLLLTQNASDADVDVTATMSIPETDSAKKKGRFVTKAARLVVGLKPAEVGYVVLPVSTLPDTAIGADYKIGVEIKATPLLKGSAKPMRVRLPEGGEFEPTHIAAETLKKLDELKGLTFVTQARSRLAPNTLETNLSVMSGKLGEIVDFKPGWVSLWTLRDHQDDRLLLYRYRDAMLNQVLPKLKRARLFQPLLDATSARFEKAGYPLKPIEAQFVAKLLTLLLEYASPSEVSAGGHGGLAAGNYNLLPLLDQSRLADPRPITVPHWCRAFLRTMTQEANAANHPVEVIARLLYPELLRDALLYAFQLIEQNTGEELGSEEEMRTYGETVLAMLAGERKLDFIHAYMPLVLGGLLIFDSVIMPGEKLDELVNATKRMLEERAAEKNADNELVFSVGGRLLDRAIMKYGYRELD